MITAVIPSRQSSLEQLPFGHAERFSDKGYVHDNSPDVMLSPLPFIVREPTHGDLTSDSNAHDQGCIYLQGDVIHADSPIIAARLAELKSSADSSSQPENPVDGGHETVSRPMVLTASSRSREQEGLDLMDSPATPSNSTKPPEENDLLHEQAVPMIGEGGSLDSNTNGVAEGQKINNPSDETFGWRTTSLKQPSDSETVLPRNEEISKWAESFDRMRSASGRR